MTNNIQSFLDCSKHLVSAGDEVTLNPERDEVVSMAASVQHTQQKAA